jgi:uncharacterized protein YjaZ
MNKLQYSILVLFFTACSQPAMKTNIDNIANGNKVIYLGRYYVNYIDTMGVDTANRLRYYNGQLFYPIMNNYFSKPEYSFLIGARLHNPFKNIVGLRANVSEINNDRLKIDSLISIALIASNRYLKNNAITIYVSPVRPSDREEIKEGGGISGTTAGSKDIFVAIDPEVSGWEQRLEYVIAHEYNHAYWIMLHPSLGIKSWTVLADIISEGKADSYAHLLYPKETVLGDTITSYSKDVIWRKIRPYLDSTSSDDIMNGEDSAKIFPKWSGYIIGYAIVQSALKNNPQLTPEEWSSLKPEDLFKMSDYK